MATVYTLNRSVRLSQFRLYDGDFPDRLRSARHQLQNMFQVPILFYLLCLLHILFDNYGQLDIVLSWLFVVFRLIHFFIRIQNQVSINVLPRTLIFVLSLLFLTLGWIKLFIDNVIFS